MDGHPVSDVYAVRDPDGVGVGYRDSDGNGVGYRNPRSVRDSVGYAH